MSELEAISKRAKDWATAYESGITDETDNYERVKEVNSDLPHLLKRNANLESAIRAIEGLADNMSQSQTFRYVAEDIYDTLRVHLGESNE